MAGERSVAIEYLSIVLRAIERAQNDPAELRGLVYDVARFNLGTQALTGQREIDAAEFQRHVFDLEIAIKQAERLWLQEHQLPAGGANVRLLSAPDGAVDHPSVASRDPPLKANKVIPGGEVIVVHDAPADLYHETGTLSQFFQPIEIWKPAFGSGRRGEWAARWPLIGLAMVMGLAIIAYVGVAMYSVLNMRLENSRGVDFSYADRLLQNASASSMSSNTDAGRLSARALLASANPARPVADFPLPTTYGVYAVSDGKLYDLSALPIKVPDSRVAISAMISTPSHVALPNGKLSFVVFRRDLVSSAPEEASVRVVARVAREMKFGAASAPSASPVDGQWAIRSKSYGLAVAPLGDSPEMIVMRPKDAQFSFSPGRYALIVKGMGYDFSVDGKLTDTAQCLERTEAVNGTIYSECRTLPM